MMLGLFFVAYYSHCVFQKAWGFYRGYGSFCTLFRRLPWLTTELAHTKLDLHPIYLY